MGSLQKDQRSSPDCSALEGKPLVVEMFLEGKPLVVEMFLEGKPLAMWALALRQHHQNHPRDQTHLCLIGFGCPEKSDKYDHVHECNI